MNSVKNNYQNDNPSDLIRLKFKEILDVYTQKQIWVLGERDTNIFENIFKEPLLFYNIETQTCQMASTSVIDEVG